MTHGSRQDLAAAFAEARAPRYTSYPTALQFSPAVTGEVHADWLSQLGEAPVSLYVHVPFCRRLCWYCGCNTRAVNRPEPVTAYVDTLADEVAAVAGAIGGRRRVSALHLGGGSPDSLSPSDLEQMFDVLGRHFDILPDAAISAEMDPSFVTADWIATAARRGLNRASLGVQDFSPRVQAAVNRLQSFERVAQVVADLRANGIASINLDLMYGLPLQTLNDVRDTVDKAVSLRPERLAVFGYAHVPWMKLNQGLIKTADLPGAAERLAQAQAAAARLTAAGYVAIGLDHFALPGDSMALAAAQGTLRRNFQGYTTDTAEVLIGLGASSISRLPQGYLQNAPSVADWRRAVAAGRLPSVRGLALSRDDALRAEAIERIMCGGPVDVDALCAAHGVRPDTLAQTWVRLHQFALQGLVTIKGPVVAVTPRGQPLTRTVCTAFDQYFQADAQRHAAAV